MLVLKEEEDEGSIDKADLERGVLFRGGEALYYKASPPVNPLGETVFRFR